MMTVAWNVFNLYSFKKISWVQLQAHVRIHVTLIIMLKQVLAYAVLVPAYVNPAKVQKHQIVQIALLEFI